jgi:hypothetical protein
VALREYRPRGVATSTTRKHSFSVFRVWLNARGTRHSRRSAGQSQNSDFASHAIANGGACASKRLGGSVRNRGCRASRALVGAGTKIILAPSEERRSAWPRDGERSMLRSGAATPLRFRRSCRSRPHPRRSSGRRLAARACRTPRHQGRRFNRHASQRGGSKGTAHSRKLVEPLSAEDHKRKAVTGARKAPNWSNRFSR